MRGFFDRQALSHATGCQGLSYFIHQLFANHAIREAPMPLDNKNTIKLSELIVYVKNEILAAKTLDEDKVPLFGIDEVTLEVNFVLKGEAQGKFDMVVVKAGAEVVEERVQKATIHLKALISPEKLLEEIQVKNPPLYKALVKKAKTELLKGLQNGIELDVPPLD
jgi:hypothetical protein